VSRLVPGLRVALTRRATKAEAFSRTDIASLRLGLPILTTTKSGRGGETLRSFGCGFSKRRLRRFFALEFVFFDRFIPVDALRRTSPALEINGLYFVLSGRVHEFRTNLKGKALMLKSLNIQLTEQASHFSQVPPGVDYRKAIQLLESSGKS
jgi:hypothetical protein